MGVDTGNRIPTAAAWFILVGVMSTVGCSSPVARWNDGGAATPNASATGSLSSPDSPTEPPAEGAAEPSTGPSAADGDDISACYDGDCEISVSAPVDIPLHRRFMVGTLSVTAVRAAQVSFHGESPGGYVRATVGVGGTAILNRIKIRVVAIHDGVAALEFSPLT